MSIFDLVVLFIILPFLILRDSWKRLNMVGWEWLVFSILTMSILASALYDVIMPFYFKERNFFNVWVSKAIILGLLFTFYHIYLKVEQPIAESRSILALFSSLCISNIGMLPHTKFCLCFCSSSKRKGNAKNRF